MNQSACFTNDLVSTRQLICLYVAQRSCRHDFWEEKKKAKTDVMDNNVVPAATAFLRVLDPVASLSLSLSVSPRSAETGNI